MEEQNKTAKWLSKPIILYNMPDEQGKVQVVIKDETIWCAHKTTKFRQWATKILNEYIKKGFVLDDNRKPL